MPGRVVHFYFDPISPYAWLASKELARIEAAGLAVECRPILFAALLNAHGQKGPAEIPAKRAYTFRDVLRLATQKGLKVEGPPTHPFNPLRALRVCIAVEGIRERQRFALALMDGAWAGGLDLTNTSVLAAIATNCGLDAATLLAQSELPDIKARLLEATQQAIQMGVFGVPSFVLDGQIYWGADRVDTLLWASQGHWIDESQLDLVLSRQASAQR